MAGRSARDGDVCVDEEIETNLCGCRMKDRRLNRGI